LHLPETENIRAEQQMKKSPGAKRILVVDDDPPLRRVLGKILTTAGYEVMLVEDGKTAIEMAKQEKPDLVITDALMPRMHGFLVCKALKAFESPPKVIVLTAVYTQLNHRREVREKYGADDLIIKPFAVSELLDSIEKQLALAETTALPDLCESDELSSPAF
jgi:DNA-binding response OmpR family regulator